jgi:hypothetical protein
MPDHKKLTNPDPPKTPTVNIGDPLGKRVRVRHPRDPNNRYIDGTLAVGHTKSLRSGKRSRVSRAKLKAAFLEQWLAFLGGEATCTVPVLAVLHLLTTEQAKQKMAGDYLERLVRNGHSIAGKKMVQVEKLEGAASDRVQRLIGQLELLRPTPAAAPPAFTVIRFGGRHRANGELTNAPGSIPAFRVALDDTPADDRRIERWQSSDAQRRPVDVLAVSTAAELRDIVGAAENENDVIDAEPLPDGPGANGERVSARVTQWSGTVGTLMTENLAVLTFTAADVPASAREQMTLGRSVTCVRAERRALQVEV